MQENLSNQDLEGDKLYLLGEYRFELDLHNLPDLEKLILYQKAERYVGKLQSIELSRLVSLIGTAKFFKSFNNFLSESEKDQYLEINAADLAENEDSEDTEAQRRKTQELALGVTAFL